MKISKNSGLLSFAFALAALTQGTALSLGATAGTPAALPSPAQPLPEYLGCAIGYFIESQSGPGALEAVGVELQPKIEAGSSPYVTFENEVLSLSFRLGEIKVGDPIWNPSGGFGKATEYKMFMSGTKLVSKKTGFKSFEFETVFKTDPTNDSTNAFLNGYNKSLDVDPQVAGLDFGTWEDGRRILEITVRCGADARSNNKRYPISKVYRKDLQR